MTQPKKRTTVKVGIKPRSATLEADALPLSQRGVVTYSAGDQLTPAGVHLEQCREACLEVKFSLPGLLLQRC